MLSGKHGIILTGVQHKPFPYPPPSNSFRTLIQVDVQLKERIGMNVAKVMSRLDKLKPRIRNNGHGQPMAVDRAVHDLIAAAQSESNLAKMSPTFLSFV